MNTLPTSTRTSSSFRLTVLCIGGALLTYMSMYAFRKPLSAATFEGISYWGIDYKVIALISQVVGYTGSKFLGIKVVSELRPAQRIRYILGLIGVAWAALLGFALVPHPYNLPFLVVNGLPLGMIFGIVISFLEGRRNTELLGAGLCISFITASGITKAVGQFLVVHFGVSEFWMPFATGAVFVPFLLLGVSLLHRIPAPNEADKALRHERAPMDGAERRRFFHTFGLGVLLSTVVYSTLTVFRDLRDNFAVELWKQLGYANDSSILATSEICVAVLVLSLVASMIKVTDNRTAFYGNIGIFIFSGGVLLTTTYLFAHAQLAPAVWMITSGFGLYLCYICFHTMFFERWIALFRYRGSIAFLICVSDSFGYLGSVGVLLTKSFLAREVNWLTFITYAAYATGALIVGLSVLMYFYFRQKELRYFPHAGRGSARPQACPAPAVQDAQPTAGPR